MCNICFINAKSQTCTISLPLVMPSKWNEISVWVYLWVLFEPLLCSRKVSGCSSVLFRALITLNFKVIVRSKNLFHSITYHLCLRANVIWEIFWLKTNHSKSTNNNSPSHKDNNANNTLRRWESDEIVHDCCVFCVLYCLQLHLIDKLLPIQMQISPAVLFQHYS